MLTWRSHDARRMESVRVQLSGKRIKANGRIVAAAADTNPAFAAYYDLLTDETGATKRLGMTVTLAERERQLVVARDEENMWMVTDHQGESRAAYDGALDVDVVFSPFFNALPIRRVGLNERADSITVSTIYVDAAGDDRGFGGGQLQQRGRRLRRGNQGAFAGVGHHAHRRRRRVHRGLPRLGRADLITPPARPAAASS